MAEEDNDELIFSDEDEVVANVEEVNDNDNVKWKVLVVDDEEQIHHATKLVLDDYKFNSMRIEFIHAYSGEEAKRIMEKDLNIALVLLDVVMEKETAGLDTVVYIRNILKNEDVRIILRTGQPGQAPQKDVILRYDINDYKEKTELTAEKMFTAVTCAFRAYSELLLRKKIQNELEILNRDLEKKVMERTEDLVQEMEQRKLLQEKIIDSEKLAAVGGLATGVAHEFNNINTSIIGYTSLILKQQDLSEKVVKWLENIKSSVMKSSSISKNLMTYTSKDPLVLKKCAIDSFVKENVESFYSNNQGCKISVENKCDRSLEVMIDTVKLGYVINNILENANHAMINSNEKEIRVTIEKVAEQIKISFIDNGCGILSQDLGDVYLPFFTRKGEKCLDGGCFSKVKGVGLGLSVCQSVVVKHDGTIEIESVQGQGTTVVIMLPVMG